MAPDAPQPLAFTVENLAEALSNDHLSGSEVQRLAHFSYLWDYLTNLGCKAIVVERKYLDHDYLEDYTAHYATCFADYERWCKRLHFFRTEVSQAQLLELVVRPPVMESAHELGDEYLGFVVARPLPQAVIGRTILRTWEDDGGRRTYTCVRPYDASLFGVPARLSSLAFQEQDRVLGACATVALWSAFQKTAHLFGTPAPSPSVITRAASEIVHYGRPIPSDGLNVLEICRAVRHLGLEPEVTDVTAKVPLTSLVYSYLHMGLPVVLGVQVEGRGLHAITLAGYSMQPDVVLGDEIPGGGQFIPMLGRNIDRLYGHDDQIGPFARLKVVQSVNVGNTLVPGYLEGSWTDPNSKRSLSLFPRVVIVPVYHKIRLKFLDVLEWLTRLHAVLEIVFSPQTKAAWDVHLTLSNDLKRAVRRDEKLTEGMRRNLLLSPHPRFAWQARLWLDGMPVLEVLFDATGIARSFPAYGTVWRLSSFADEVEKRLSNPQLSSLFKRVLTERFHAFLLKTVRNRDCPIDAT